MPPSAPQPSRAILGESLRLYRVAYARCLPWGLLAALPAAAANIHLFRHLQGLDIVDMSDMTLESLDMVLARAHGAISFVTSAPVLVTYLLVLLAGLAGFGATLTQQQSVLHEEPRSLGSCFALALRRLPSALIATVATLVLTLVGLLLLVVPGVYLSGLLQQWPAVMFGEDTGAWRALDRSARLISGAWWQTSSVLVVPLLVIIVLWWMCDLASGLVMREWLTAAVTVAMLPFLTATMLVQHAELVQRRSRLAARGAELRAVLP